MFHHSRSNRGDKLHYTWHDFRILKKNLFVNVQVFSVQSILYKLNVADIKKCFFQSCTNSVVLIYIFFKSCTTIKKLYNQTKKLYIFGTLSLALNFIHNMVFVVKCTVFSKAVQILWSSYIYFSKAVQPLKSCTTKDKNCTSLVHCPWLLISWQWCFYQNVQFFPKLYKFCGPDIYIYLKSCTTKQKSCTSLVHCPWLLISFTMVFLPKCTVFSKAVQVLWSSWVISKSIVRAEYPAGEFPASRIFG